MKTKIYNLIVLDESGSMSCVRKQTISGCNETINTIKVAQEKYGETQEHYVSIFAFQHGGSLLSRYIVKNVSAEQAKHIGECDYLPCGSTPLYDAVGGTLADLKAVIAAEEGAIGSVTIITDGMENASRHYTHSQVAKLISELKEMGWNFNFIGANIDVEKVAKGLNIDNMCEFEQTEEGTEAMFSRERSARLGYAGKLHACFERINLDAAPEERAKALREASEGYFDEEEKNEEPKNEEPKKEKGNRSKLSSFFSKLAGKKDE